MERGWGGDGEGMGRGWGGDGKGMGRGRGIWRGCVRDVVNVHKLGAGTPIPPPLTDMHDGILCGKFLITRTVSDTIKKSNSDMNMGKTVTLK